MTIMQVKKYHREIASKKYNQSTQKIKTMFYFMIPDNFCYYERLNGYVAFDDTKSVWGRNKIRAYMKFKESKI